MEEGKLQGAGRRASMPPLGALPAQHVQVFTDPEAFANLAVITSGG